MYEQKTYDTDQEHYREHDQKSADNEAGHFLFLPFRLTCVSIGKYRSHFSL
jgi:hypothetical protein